MTITLSQQAYQDLLYGAVGESHYPDSEDELDVVYKFPQRLGLGCHREIELRDGLFLEIGNLRFHDRALFKFPERE